MGAFSHFMTTTRLFVILLLLCNRGNAQVCTGSLGDPAASISFGYGNNPGPALPLGTTTYNRSTRSCPDVGEYFIGNLTFACFDQAWHTLAGDHTPNDAGGYYMLINAGYQAGEFYKETVHGLCGSTNYQFGAWALNMMKAGGCGGAAIHPNLTFKLETTAGQLLATLNTGDIRETASPEWKNFGVFFQLPAGITDVVVRITNNSSGGCGNDLVLDDITFRPCGPSISAALTATNIREVQVCEGATSSFLLDGNYAGGYTNPAFQWQLNKTGTWQDIAGANSTSFLRTPTGPGFYLYRFTVADGINASSPQCRVNSNDIIVAVNAKPYVQLTNYVFGCYGSPVGFIASGGQKYQWTGPNGFNSSQQAPVIPQVQYNDAGKYHVRVTTVEGCSDTGSIDLSVYPAAHAFSGSDVTVCEGDSAIIEAGGGLKYFWYPQRGLSNDSIATPYAHPKDSTVYRAIVTNQYGCTDTATVRVNVLRIPHVDAGKDTRTRVGLPIALHGDVKGTNVNYYWTPASFMNNPNALQPIVNPPQSMIFTLHVESNNGCGVVSDNVFVKVYDHVIIPNAFSPNGDGINDTWVITPLELFEQSVTEVYDRYGRIVYRSKGYPQPWDGKRNGTPVPIGVYYYIINTNINHEPPLTGSLVIVR